MKKRLIIGFLAFSLLDTIAFADQVVRIAPLTISITASKTTATGTETALPAAALKGRENITIQNTSASTETVWIGPTGVTSSTGFPLDSDTPSLSIDIDDSVTIFVISDGTSVDVRTLESK